MLFRLSVALLALLVTACATQVAEQDTVVVPDTTNAEPAPAVPEVPERPFPDDSIYDLLLAEFALRRGEYNLALDTYLELAPELSDPGVSAHATYLSQYFERDGDTRIAAQQWVELEPDNIEARAILAQQLVLQGQNAEALEHLAAIAEVGGAANFAIVTRNFSLLPPAQRSEIVTGLDALSNQYPDNTSLLLTQALLYEESNQPSQALEKLDKLFELEPQLQPALLLEAKILADQGEDDPYWRIEEALEQDPDNRALRMRYARLLANNDMRAARTQFEILSAQSPRDGDLLFSLALINREVGDPLAASAYLRQLLALEQREDEAHYYLGRLNEDREQFDEALLHYKAVEDGREYMAANSRIGEILLQSGNLEGSLEWFAQQRKAHPQRSIDLYSLEAELLGKAGEDALALELLNEALAQSPGDASLLYARAMLRERSGDLESMEADLRRIIADDPGNATALNALGYTLANRTQRYEEAYELISRALELQPGEPAIMDSMGWVLYRLGRPEDAIGYLRRAYADFPDPEVAAHLGEVMWTLGDTDGAMEIWRSAYAQDPDHPVLSETLQRLQIDPLDRDQDV